MPFSEASDKPLTYSGYLKIDELLRLQQPLSDDPEHDEMLFIIIHQVYELWFKQIIHELEKLQEELVAGNTTLALSTLKRVLTILKTLVAQVDVLETMTPMSFNAFRERLANPQLRDSIKAGIIFNLINDRGGADLDRVQFAKVSWMPELEGKTLKYWSGLKGLEPTMENGADLVIEAQVNRGASCVFHAMDEGDVERILKHPQTMVASDGRLVAPGMGHPHPRWYGTFPRVLGRYVREKEVLSLPEAIHKMTALPATAMGLTDRGLLREGMKADLVIFNPETVADKATFEKPHQYPEGIPYVIINGQVSLDNGEFQHLKAGEVLRKPKS